MLKKVQQMCEDNNVELLYLCKFGSDLYGTSTNQSDTDYKGIFLPSKNQCYLQTYSKSINYSSGKDNLKNSKDDVDIQLWSLQYFLKLVSKGETNALDLLYSFTYPDVITFKHEIMNQIFKNHFKFYNVKDCNSFISYSMSQARKYGIKGSRMGVLKNVCEYVQSLQHFEDEALSLWLSELKLSTYLTGIVKNYHDKSFCFVKSLKGIDSLVLCGKVHQGTITLNEFYNRIKKQYDQYGERARLASLNIGIDWKAISHAARAITQMKQLIETGMISFPLHNAEYLSNIKQGKLSFKEVEKIIYDGIEDVSHRLKNVTENKKDSKLIENIIIGAYKC